jgi:hypothetical protein
MQHCVYTAGMLTEGASGLHTRQRVITRTAVSVTVAIQRVLLIVLHTVAF